MRMSAFEIRLKMLPGENLHPGIIHSTFDDVAQLADIAWGIIYSVLGLALYGILYSNFVRRCGAQTLPEFLEMRYDKRTRSIVAITSVIGMCGIMANNIVTSVNNITAYTGWSSAVVTAVIFVVIIAFVYISGMWAISMTDFVQVILGVVVVPMVFFMTANRYGWLDAIRANWPTDNLMMSGYVGNMKGMALTYPSVLNFVICFAVALVWGNNYYWMKISNCRSEKVARNSYVIATIALVIIFVIPLALLGAYVGAFHGDVLTLNGGTVVPTGAYGFISSTLIPLLGALAVIGAVAASISTAATSALGASAVMTRDIYSQLINRNADNAQRLRASKIIMIIVGVATFILCQFPDGPTYLFAFANCWLVPPAILVGLGILWKKFNSKGAFWGALCGMIVMAVLELLDLTGVFHVGNYIYLATLGLIVTLVAAVIASLSGEPAYFGKDGWELVPTDSNRENVDLTDLDIEALKLIRIGHLYMADITDYLGVDSNVSNACIERLDKGGYIQREGLSKSALYTFHITDKGEVRLGRLEGTEAEMAKQGLSPMYVEFLQAIAKSPEAQNQFVKDYSIRFRVRRRTFLWIQVFMPIISLTERHGEAVQQKAALTIF